MVINRGQRWGGLQSGAGDQYVGLQVYRSGSAELSQNITCLHPGDWYKLSFMAACRPGYGNEYEFIVQITGLPARVFSQTKGDFSSSDFRQLDIQFKANTSVATVRFIHIPTGSDRTVFLDDVRIEQVSQPDGSKTAVVLMSVFGCVAFVCALLVFRKRQDRASGGGGDNDQVHVIVHRARPHSSGAGNNDVTGSIKSVAGSIKSVADFVNSMPEKARAMAVRSLDH